MNKSNQNKTISDCAITLFIQYKKEVVPHRIKGDKYTLVIAVMISNLYRYALKRRLKTVVMIIYDNRKPTGENIVMKWEHGILTIDNSHQYGFDDINTYGHGL